MRASNYILPTIKEDPQDAVVASHKLMTRAGFIRKMSSGLYSYLPIGLRVLKKIEAIIRQEMDAAGALEFELPILTSAEIWKESGRWDKMGKEMFRIGDRHDNQFALGPTHEESFCDLLKPVLKSYKDLPINVYQIHTKFRDEIRPRFGVIRSREFTMKDAYSFHLDEVSLNDTYQKMRVAYRKSFSRMGLKTTPVQADSGAMGGSESEEFMVVSPIGEETLLYCKSCEYSSNLEKTPTIPKVKPPSVDAKYSEKKEIHTPSLKSILEVSNFLKVDQSNTIKAVALASGKRNFLVYLPGDRELNENKFSAKLGLSELYPMSDSQMQNFGLVAGFIGLLDSTPKDLEVYIDSNILPDVLYITGANKVDYHLSGVSFASVLQNDHTFDLSQARVGDLCPSCGKDLFEDKGIEVGHIFKLGKKYTEAFGIKVLNQNGKPETLTMGCYGIGVNRCMATIIEQCNDEKGIFWPISVAPFEVSLVSIAKQETEIQTVSEFYEECKNSNIDIFWDDRDLGPGFKFKDAELIGFPIRVTIGKNYFEKQEVSIQIRKTSEEILLQNATPKVVREKISELIQRLYKELEIV